MEASNGMGLPYIGQAKHLSSFNRQDHPDFLRRMMNKDKQMK